MVIEREESLDDLLLITKLFPAQIEAKAVMYTAHRVKALIHTCRM